MYFPETLFFVVSIYDNSIPKYNFYMWRGVQPLYEEAYGNHFSIVWKQNYHWALLSHTKGNDRWQSISMHSRLLNTCGQKWKRFWRLLTTPRWIQLLFFRKFHAHLMLKRVNIDWLPKSGNLTFPDYENVRFSSDNIGRSAVHLWTIMIDRFPSSL